MTTKCLASPSTCFCSWYLVSSRNRGQRWLADVSSVRRHPLYLIVHLLAISQLVIFFGSSLLSGRYVVLWSWRCLGWGDLVKSLCLLRPICKLRELSSSGTGQYSRTKQHRHCHHVYSVPATIYCAVTNIYPAPITRHCHLPASHYVEIPVAISNALAMPVCQTWCSNAMLWLRKCHRLRHRQHHVIRRHAPRNSLHGGRRNGGLLGRLVRVTPRANDVTKRSDVRRHNSRDTIAHGPSRRTSFRSGMQFRRAPQGGGSIVAHGGPWRQVGIDTAVMSALLCVGKRERRRRVTI